MKRNRNNSIAASKGEPSRHNASFEQLQFDFRHIVFVGVCLATLVAAIYWPVHQFDFIAYDDPGYVTENPHVLQGFTWSSVQWAFTTGAAANWHPVTWLSHLLDVQLFGLRAGPHHVTNVLIHAVNCGLLFGLIFSMTGGLGRSAFVAALFAVHPLQVESVAWIAERKNVLSTMFALLALWAYIVYVRRRGRQRYLLVVGLFALGLMAKPMLVTLPCVMLLLDWWPLQRICLPLLSKPQRPTLYKLAIEKIPLFALAAGSSIITVIVQHGGGAVRTFEEIPPPLRIWNATVSYAAYLSDALWPVHLAIFYPFPNSIAVWKITASLLFLVTVTFVVCRLARPYPYLVTGWFWYLGTLVPVIGIVQVGDQSMADRYAYIPLIGIFLLVAWASHEIMSRSRAGRIFGVFVGVFTILVLAVQSRVQLGYWKNNLVVWNHALSVTDGNYAAHVHVGTELLSQGKKDEAVAHYNKALQLRPNYDLALDDVAIVLLNEGKSKEALPYLLKAVKANPTFGHAHNDLGVAMERDGRTNDAIFEYSEAGRLDPNLEVAHVNLAKLLVTHGKVDEAISEYMQAIRLKADDPIPHYDLGLVFNSKGDVQHAVSEFRAALAINPTYREAQQALNYLANSTLRQ